MLLKLRAPPLVILSFRGQTFCEQDEVKCHVLSYGQKIIAYFDRGLFKVDHFLARYHRSNPYICGTRGKKEFTSCLMGKNVLLYILIVGSK